MRGRVNNHPVLFLVSIVGMLVSAAMLLCAAVSKICDFSGSFPMFFLCGFIPFVISGYLVYRFRIRQGEPISMERREGFMVVVFSWIAAAVIGSLPYFFVLGLHWYDAFFESMSGFTTAGATILGKNTPLLIRCGGEMLLKNGVEDLPKGILFWRMMTIWLGGMGVIVLFLAIMPLLNVGGQLLYNAESSDIQTSGKKILSRTNSSAKLLWCFYFLLTQICVCTLVFYCGVNWFESVCQAFSTIATGGFSTRLNGWQDIQRECAHPERMKCTLIVFMFISSCSFSLLYMAFFHRRWKNLFRNEEIRFFVLEILSVSVFAAFAVTLSRTSGVKEFFRGFPSYLKDILFLTVSNASSTGYSLNEYSSLPVSAGILFIAVLMIGGCGGSTAGGMKCIRAILLGKISIYEIRHCVSPHLMQNIRLDGVLVEQNTQSKTMMFLLMYAGTFLQFSFLYAAGAPNLAMQDVFTISLGCLTNSGFSFPVPDYMEAGSYCPYVSPWIKFCMCFEMLAGRLEIYTVFSLLLPSFWKR